MVDGINSYRAIDNMTNGSNGGRNFSVKNGTSKQSIFLEKKPNYEIDGGTLPEVVVTAQKPEVAAAAKPKRGFFAWLGRTLGLSKA